MGLPNLAVFCALFILYTDDVDCGASCASGANNLLATYESVTDIARLARAVINHPPIRLTGSAVLSSSTITSFSDNSIS